MVYCIINLTITITVLLISILLLLHLLLLLPVFTITYYLTNRLHFLCMCTVPVIDHR